MGNYSKYYPRSEMLNTAFIIAITSILIGCLSAMFYNVQPLFVSIIILVSSIVISMVNAPLAVGVIAFWIAFQNIIILFLYNAIPEPDSVWTTILSLSQFTAMIVVFVRFFLYHWGGKIKFPSWIKIGLISTVATLALTLGETKSFHALNSVRGILVPFLYVALGSTIPKSEKIYMKVIRGLSLLTFIGGAFALFDAFFLSLSFWQHLNVGDYWINVKGVPQYSIWNGVPGNYTEAYGNTILRRTGSIYGDPLAAGYSMALGLATMLIAFTKTRKKKTYIFMMAVVIGGIIVTYTRAAYIMVGIEIITYYFYRRSSGKKIAMWKIGILAIPCIAITWNVLKGSLLGQNNSEQVHLSAFATIPALIKHPMGFGPDALPSPEGTFLSIWFKFGIVVILVFCMFLFKLYKGLNTSLGVYRYMSKGAMLAMIISGFISAEMVTDTASSIGWILVGMTIGFTGNAEKTEDAYPTMKPINEKRIATTF